MGVEDVELIACDEHGEGLAFGFLAGDEINERVKLNGERQ